MTLVVLAVKAVVISSVAVRLPMRHPTHMADIRVAFGKAVRRLRAGQELSQEDFAHKAKIDRSYMGRVERGEVNISIDNMQKIAKGLGLTVGRLMTEADIEADRRGSAHGNARLRPRFDFYRFDLPDPFFVRSAIRYASPAFGVGGNGSPRTTVRSFPVRPPRGPRISYCAETGAFVPGVSFFPVMVVFSS
jgi:transcriptional regulator with XRE-family HTH domain